MDKAIRDKYQAVIGLEVHAQLLTNSKIFNSDSSEYGSLPNTNVSPITLAHPGTLPKLNKKAVEYAIKIGLACESEISREQTFDRKNYFYPDLPKGYQITQDKTPICVGGEVLVKPREGAHRKIKLNRIHLEEDAGKSTHLAEEEDTLVDFNRSGVALIEIVTEPDIRTSDEAFSFVAEIRKLVRYLEICDGNMEEGSLRCDANISVMRVDANVYGTKCEVKNMNSMRNVQRAIDHEIIRQIGEIEAGNPIVSQSRSFDPATGTTAAMRSKEELNDYRYFSDPDLSILRISDDWLASISRQMPSLPNELYNKYVKDFELSAYDAEVLTETKEVAQYFEELCTRTSNYKGASNWIMGPIKSYLNETSSQIDRFPVTAELMAEVIKLVEEGKLSFSAASQRLFPEMVKNASRNPLSLAEEMNLIQDSNTESLELLVDEVLGDFPEKVAAYKSGKKGLIGMFMGEVMKRSNDKADPKVTSQLLGKKLN
jgi:aspartyl-tRNA(Asn)/glutamyl-tRNA(Gln) amidotransferase subunit B